MQFVAPQLGFLAGKLDTITNGDMNEFAHGKGGRGFLNLAFCFNPIAAITVPYSALGAGIVILPTSNPKEFIITISVIDTEGDPGDAGFDTAFKGGTTYAAEARYTTHFFGMTGHHLIGGAYSDRAYVDLDQDLRNIIIPDLPVQTQSGSWFVNYNFDQYIYQPDPKVDRGLGIWGRFGGSDGVANPIHLFYSGGIGGKGLIPGRERDTFGIGFYYAQTANARIPQRLNFGDGQGFEAYYEIALTPWARFTPDIQWINPSQRNESSAWVLGARLELDF
jgi:porin